MNRLIHHIFRLIPGVLAVVSPGCFRGDFYAGQRCRSDADCGPRGKCNDEICGDVAGSGGGDAGEPNDDADYGHWVLEEKVDILFVIDNSGSMGEEQENFVESITPLAELLERPETTRSYHIGVTTTDNGNPWCQGTTPEGGDLVLSSCRERAPDFLFEGATTLDTLQEACLDRCPSSWPTIQTLPSPLSLDGDQAPRKWIEVGETETNLPEGLELEQALNCILPQGINGCGFESHLESMRTSLLNSSDPEHPNWGFLRDGALLSIVFITDEADCSYNPEHETIFLPNGNRVFWSNPENPAPTSAVCWNAGVACTGSGLYDECHAVDLNEDGEEVSGQAALDEAVLHPVSSYVDFVQSLNRDALVWVISGVKSDGTITYQDGSDLAVLDDFGIGYGCEGDGGGAIPPVRLAEFAEAFRPDDTRNLFSVCDDDYGPALDALAEAIAESIDGTLCVPFCVADTDPSTTQRVDPRCYLTQRAPREDGEVDITSVLPCDGDQLPADADVCYRTLVGDDMVQSCADEGFNLQLDLIRREGTFVPGTSVTAKCLRSRAEDVDCPLLR